MRNGANSPIAGITHAVTLLLVVLLAAPLAKYIPLTVLGAVLLVVAYNMGDWQEFRVLHKHTKSDAAVFVVTFVLTVVFDLTVAVEVGMVLAAGLFIKRVTDTTQVRRWTRRSRAAKGTNASKRAKRRADLSRIRRASFRCGRQAGQCADDAQEQRHAWSSCTWRRLLRSMAPL